MTRSRTRTNPTRQRKLRRPRNAGTGSVTAPSTASGGERLQKAMANAGLGSRRSLEAQIRAGVIRVNGRPASLGQSVRAGDRIALEGRQWRVKAGSGPGRTLIYNKTEGEVTLRNDPEGRPTVFDRLPRLPGARWVAIGRLDINTTGLLLLTTDGELAHAMMHPARQLDREYVCRIHGAASADQIEKLRSGVLLDDGPARFNDIDRIGGGRSNTWFKVTLSEGRNREVRRLWESQGLQVSRLKRVRYGTVMLPDRLRMGRWIELSAADHAALRRDGGLGREPLRLSLEQVETESPNGRRAHRPRRGTQARSERRRPQRRPETSPGSSASPGRGPRRRPETGPGSPAGPGRRSPRQRDRMGRR